jgi:hypothetical protein
MINDKIFRRYNHSPVMNLKKCFWINPIRNTRTYLQNWISKLVLSKQATMVALRKVLFITLAISMARYVSLGCISGSVLPNECLEEIPECFLGKIF